MEATRQWSPQQQAIFDRFKNPESGNLVVRARAGTGKTTTIITAIEYAPEHSILLAAFNKRIAEELVTKLRNPRATAKTLHSVGFTLVGKAWGRVRVDADRGFRLARTAWVEWSGGQAPSAAPNVIVTLVAKLASLGKNAAPFATAGELVDHALAADCVPQNGWDKTYRVDDIASMARKAMTLALTKDGSVDFDDMIYLPVVCKWVAPSFDLVVIDEAQDMNLTQLLLARGIARGRTVVVGDDRQAIYRFRGADSNAIDRLKVELNADELPLTTTYRCPSKVVELAAALVPDYAAAPTAPEGEVLNQTEEAMLANAAPGDFILSRTNAPLARTCLALLRQGRSARIEGRDIAKGLVALVRRTKAPTIAQMASWLDEWAENEVEKLRGRTGSGVQARVDYIRDQVETLEALGEGLKTTDELTARIEALFGPSAAPAVVCSTVHKAKGLEADRVFVLADTLYCNGKRKNREEENIHYVAITRAKRTLVLVARPRPLA